MQLNLEDHTIEISESIRSDSNKIKKNNELRLFISRSRIVTGIIYNQFLSRFELDENYDSHDISIFIAEDEKVTNECNFEAHESITIVIMWIHHLFLI